MCVCDSLWQEVGWVCSTDYSRRKNNPIISQICSHNKNDLKLNEIMDSFTHTHTHLYCKHSWIGYSSHTKPSIFSFVQCQIFFHANSGEYFPRVCMMIPRATSVRKVRRKAKTVYPWLHTHWAWRALTHSLQDKQRVSIVHIKASLSPLPTVVPYKQERWDLLGYTTQPKHCV